MGFSFGKNMFAPDTTVGNNALRARQSWIGQSGILEKKNFGAATIQTNMATVAVRVRDIPNLAIQSAAHLHLTSFLEKRSVSP